MSTELSEAVLDACYDALSEELNRWELVGPLRRFEGEYWMVRSRLSIVDLVNPSEAIEELTMTFHDFSEKKYAITFMHYKGMEAAIRKFNEISGDAASASQPALADTEDGHSDA